MKSIYIPKKLRQRLARLHKPIAANSGTIQEFTLALLDSAVESVEQANASMGGDSDFKVFVDPTLSRGQLTIRSVETDGELRTVDLEAVDDEGLEFAATDTINGKRFRLSLDPETGNYTVTNECEDTPSQKAEASSESTTT